MYVPGEGREVTTVDLTDPFNTEVTPSSAVVTGLGELLHRLAMLYWCVVCVSLIDGQGCCCCTQLRLYDTSYL